MRSSDATTEQPDAPTAVSPGHWVVSEEELLDAVQGAQRQSYMQIQPTLDHVAAPVQQVISYSELLSYSYTEKTARNKPHLRARANERNGRQSNGN